MLIKRPRGWEPPESAATPEHVYMNRRQIMAAGGAAVALVALPRFARGETVPTADLYPARRNLAYRIERDVTPEDINGMYNNFYEFGSHKQIFKAAQALKVRPWTVKIDGEVEKPLEMDIDALIRKMGLEERLYRHRCVEAWSMTVPWTGFPVSRLVEMAKPLSSAKYLRMETFHDPDTARGQRQSWYPWPYVEGLTMAEATHDLAFMVTGAYGKPAAPPRAVEIRLQVDQVDRPRFVRARAAGQLLGGDRRRRVRLLGQRQPAGAASALEPGDRAGARHRRAYPDQAVQRLWRLCRRPLFGARGRKALYVGRREKPVSPGQAPKPRSGQWPEIAAAGASRSASFKCGAT